MASATTYFLVQLNGQYEGQATGETFNFEGKTDILVRVDGRNVFIAECKFWGGPGQLRKTVDQILRYTSWRDTKAAIFIFNRDRKLTTVLAKIPEAIAQHATSSARSPTEARQRSASFSTTAMMRIAN